MKNGKLNRLEHAILYAVLMVKTGKVRQFLGGFVRSFNGNWETMKRICSYCRAYMGEKPGRGVTHGICEKCLNAIKKERYGYNV